MAQTTQEVDLTRLAAFCNAHQRGVSFRRIGEPHDLSAQRVRTIITKYGYRIGYDHHSRSFTPHPAQIPFLED